MFIFFYPQQIRSLMTKVCSNTTAVAVMVFNLFDSSFYVCVLFAYKTLPFAACSRSFMESKKESKKYFFPSDSHLHFYRYIYVFLYEFKLCSLLTASVHNNNKNFLPSFPLFVYKSSVDDDDDDRDEEEKVFFSVKITIIKINNEIIILIFFFITTTSLMCGRKIVRFHS